jgi:hypothetical protein
MKNTNFGSWSLLAPYSIKTDNFLNLFIHKSLKWEFCKTTKQQKLQKIIIWMENKHK